MSKMFALFESTLRQAVKEVDAERLAKEQGEKFCFVCVNMHPIEEFGWTDKTHTKRKSICKACAYVGEKRSLAKGNGRAKRREYQRQYNIDHKQAHSRRNKARYQAERKAIA